MIRRPPRSTQSRSSAASEVYKRQSLTSAISPVFASIRIRARRENVFSLLPFAIDSDTNQNGCLSRPWRRSRICVFSGVNSTSCSAAAIACSLVIRICESWQLRATKNASRSTATTTPNRGHVGRRSPFPARLPSRLPASAKDVTCPCRPRRSDGRAEPVPDVRAQHDHQDDHDADDRDRHHRVLERLHVRLVGGELDLAVALPAHYADVPPRPPRMWPAA